MKLDKWMELNNMTQTALAKELQVYPGQIHHILSGRWLPRPKLAKKIRDYTNNQVTLDDIYDMPTRDEMEIKKAEEKKAFDPKIDYEEIAKIVLEKLTKLIEGKQEKQEVTL